MAKRPQQDSSPADETRFVVGVHPVEELVRSSPKSVVELLVADGPRRPNLDMLIKSARSAGVNVQTVPMRVLDQRTRGLRHQGIVAVTEAFPYVELEPALNALKDKPKALVVLLDSLQDPHNFGAIVRSACA